LVGQFKYAQKKRDSKREIRLFKFYKKNIKRINNWDLVDLSAPYIMGGFFLERKDRSQIYKLAKSQHLWSRRIAVLSTAMFIRNGDFKDILKLAKMLLYDKHDLMHKAVGWMLREVGKKNQKVLEKFLNKWAYMMPRTMLRYAIEKLPEKQRQNFLNKYR
jgi:3-methyladenine DNA glycosylase AlkD